MKYYVLQVVGDVEPVLHGPFATPDERDKAALKLRSEDGEKENGLYRINAFEHPVEEVVVVVDSYSGGEFPD